MERVLFRSRELPPLPPDVAQDPDDYVIWVARREEQRLRSAPLTAGSHLGLVLPLDGASEDDVERTLGSLGRQTSPRWSLTIATTEQRLASVQRLLRRCLSRRIRRRVSILPLAAGSGARDLVHEGLATHAGSGVALLVPGDHWAPDAVALLGSALVPDGVVYADEDQLCASDAPAAPRLKPDYSPDFLLSSSYIGRPFAVGSEVALALAHLDANDLSALEHEFTLAACDTATTVTHLPEVLCRRSGPQVGAATGDARRVEEALRRRGETAAVSTGKAPGTLCVARRLPGELRVSILIPFRDEPRLLRTCVESVMATSGELDVELVLIDNGSTEPEVLTLMDRLAERPNVHVVSDPRPFNWARLNNVAAGVARGEILVFLNNDIEARQDSWLGALCAHALRPEVGAAGARLVYPDGRLQHCGLVVGLGGAAGHPLAGLSPDASGYLNMAVSTRECSAVTGACLATRRAVFDRLEGFDESLGVDLNDVDYCLRAAAAGYRTIYEPAAELVHHESPSRGTAGGVGDIVKFLERWEGYIRDGDPYLNQHLTRLDSSCRLARSDEADAWSQWHSTLTNR